MLFTYYYMILIILEDIHVDAKLYIPLNLISIFFKNTSAVLQNAQTEMFDVNFATIHRKMTEKLPSKMLFRKPQFSLYAVDSAQQRVCMYAR